MVIYTLALTLLARLTIPAVIGNFISAFIPEYLLHMWSDTVRGVDLRYSAYTSVLDQVPRPETASAVYA
jgi:hypothetical protein